MANPIPTRQRSLVKSREMSRCLRCGSPIITSECHHRRSKSVHDEHMHCPCNMVSLCGTCHRWVHAHPSEARRDGMIVSRHETTPGTVPVVAHFGALLLGCNGTFMFDTSDV